MNPPFWKKWPKNTHPAHQRSQGSCTEQTRGRVLAAECTRNAKIKILIFTSCKARGCEPEFRFRTNSTVFRPLFPAVPPCHIRDPTAAGRPQLSHSHHPAAGQSCWVCRPSTAAPWESASRLPKEEVSQPWLHPVPLLAINHVSSAVRKGTMLIYWILLYF